MTIRHGPSPLQTETQPRTALRVPKPIDVVQIQSTATTVYTARDDADFQISSLVASNVSGGASYVTVYIVPDGGAAGAANMIVHQLAIAANASAVIFDEQNKGLLSPGSFVQALCQANDDVNMYGHGYDYQGEYA